jgi:hypothetical protein
LAESNETEYNKHKFPAGASPRRRECLRRTRHAALAPSVGVFPLNTKACATYQDVDLILRLYEMRRETKLREARDWFAKSFKVKTVEEFNQLCPLGSEQNAYYRMVISYWEMVASFLTSGVLHQELFFESGGELLFVWERIRDVLPGLRQANKSPRNLKNLQKVAEAYIKWFNEQAPGFYEAFSQRVRG